MKNLLALLNSKNEKRQFNIDTAGDVTTIYLYEIIVSDPYWGGIDALSFNKELAGISSPLIKLRINSPGGDIFAARAMAQAIKEHPSKVEAYVDGVAASAATYLVLAADTSYISPGGMFMIHNSASLAFGTSVELAEMSDLLARTDATINAEYVQKTGKTAEEIKAWMDAETYFYGQEAIDAGFIDQISPVAIKNDLPFTLKNVKEEQEEEADDTEVILHRNQSRLRIQQSFLVPKAA